MQFKGASAIITGGASGLGEGTARRLAAEGCKVGIFDLNEERGEALAKELGGVFAKVNVADVDSVKAGFEKVRAANGQERILVNCAGIGWAEKTARRFLGRYYRPPARQVCPGREHQPYRLVQLRRAGRRRHADP